MKDQWQGERRARAQSIRAKGIHIADRKPEVAARRVDMICVNCTMEHAMLRLKNYPHTIMCHYCGAKTPCRDLVE